MKQRTLEMKLQALRPVPSPRPYLEQYATPPDIAAMTLFQAFILGDIKEKRILDLGCGNGILGIGAALLGASGVVGVDAASNALDAARENVVGEGLGECIQLIQGRIEDMEPNAAFFGFHPERTDAPVFDTCIMNPPFGCQTRGADIPFLSAALDMALVVYSFHMASTQDYISEFVNGRSRTVTHSFLVKMEIPWMFSFHKLKKSIVDVGLFRIAGI